MPDAVIVIVGGPAGGGVGAGAGAGVGAGVATGVGDGAAGDAIGELPEQAATAPSAKMRKRIRNKAIATCPSGGAAGLDVLSYP